jgi:hypothetical protein
MRVVVNVINNDITQEEVTEEEKSAFEEWIASEEAKDKPPTTDELIKTLSDDNADLMFQNAMQDMNIKGLQDENADLLLRIAMIEMGGSV